MEKETHFQRVKKALIASVVGLMVVTLALLLSVIFQFGLTANLVMSWILTTAYAIFAFFLIQPEVRINPIQYVEKPVIQEVERIVEKEVPIQIPMENRVIEVVEKPVYFPVEKIKIVKVRVNARHKKLNIPKFKYLGSKETKRYHKRTCKFSKLIKRNYKIHSNSKAMFKRKHFKACKACMKR